MHLVLVFPCRVPPLFCFLSTGVHLTARNMKSSTTNSSYPIFNHTLPIDSLQSGADADCLKKKKFPSQSGAIQMNYTETAQSP